MLFNTRGAHYEWFDDNTCSSQPLGSFDLFEDKYESAPAFSLWSFGIKKDYDHNKGFGQKMLKEAIALANGKPIYLYVYKTNAPAIHIYQKAGFRIVGKYMGEQAWKMVLESPVTTNNERELVQC